MAGKDTMKTSSTPASENYYTVWRWRRHLFLQLVASLILCLTSVPVALSATPRVAVFPLDTSQAARFSYLGKAIQQMLISRLDSENLDVIEANSAAVTPEEGGSADFLVTGSVRQEKGNTIGVDLRLLSQDSNSPVAEWKLQPSSIDAIVTEIGRHSILIGQKISNIENQRLISENAPEMPDDETDGDAPLLNDETLRIARIHPDLLYREAPEDQKGTAVPIDRAVAEESPDTAEDDAGPSLKQLREETEQAASGNAANSAIDEDDDWQPDYPPVYEDEEEAHVKKAPSLRQDAENDDETWAEDYPPEYESSVTVSRRKRPDGTPKGNSWFSWLWPFGNSSEQEERAMPKPVPEERLPYPVPKAIGDLESSLPDQAGMQSALTASLSSPDAGKPDTTGLANPSETNGHEEMDISLSHQEEAGRNATAAHTTTREMATHEKTDNSSPTIEGEEDGGAVKEAEEGRNASRVTASGNRESKNGWFSWLWPSSWKGGDTGSAHTASATATAEEAQKDQNYQASSEPPPQKGNGPVWIWE